MDPIAPMFAVAQRTAPNIAALAGTHAFEHKLDGVRAIVYCDGKTTRILNRTLTDITATYPDVTARFGPVGPMILDGEIVAHDLSFESIQLRDRQTKPASIARMVAQIPVRFVAFDVLRLGERNYQTAPYTDRRGTLEALHRHNTEMFDLSFMSLTPDLLDHTRQLGLEGVIAKRLTSTYQQGRRSPDWVKYKTTRRVSCIPVGYEAGTGSRTHFGAMTLAMIGPTGPVVVGRVGTGFNAREITELKTRLDTGQLFVVEIEALNRTKTGQLRFPVYRGIRSDLTPVDCSIDQLHALPTC